MRDLGRRSVATLWVLAAACGGDDDVGDGTAASDPAPAAEVTERCGSFDVHATTCGWGGNVNGYDWNCGEAGIVWRAAAFRAFVGCAIALPCDGEGRTCLQAANDAVEPIAAHELYASRCTARLGECAHPTTVCAASIFELYTDSFVAPITACFDLACGEILACLERGG